MMTRVKRAFDLCNNSYGRANLTIREVVNVDGFSKPDARLLRSDCLTHKVIKYQI